MRSILNKLIREDNFLSLAGNVLIAVFGIGGFAIMARLFSMEIFGQWVLFLAGASFIEMFRFGITGNGLIRFLSGANEKERKAFIASNSIISLFVSILVAVVLWFLNLFFKDSFNGSGFELFFQYYPVLIIVNLPWNNAITILQSKLEYGKILFIKALNSGLFFIYLSCGSFFFELALEDIALTLILINLLTSVVCVWFKWDGISYIFYTSITSIKTLLHFGKYTTFTLIGTNLLRNADTFIISLSPLGPAAVALYSIPLKLTELQQIPLRSFVATAFPKMSKASMSNNKDNVVRLFYTYSGALTFLFIFGSIITFLFADLLVLILSGAKYSGTDPITGFNAADIVRVFSIYGLLLPIDRMTGIALDSINKPKINALKVLFMVSFNIIGDLIAIFIFESLIMVAVASIIFTVVGIWLGMFFLKKELPLSYSKIYAFGLNFYSQLWAKLKLTLLEFKVKPTKNEII